MKMQETEKPQAEHNPTPKRGVVLAIVVAALGYFVDIYDLILFGVIRVDSLKDIGLTQQQIQTDGEIVLSVQMIGLLLGGIVWGIIGDRKGRLSVLFGSILIYSLANIANGFVNDLTSYAVLRFIAGIGLAGELGAGITLVSELMTKEKRGYGTTIVAAFGLLGAVVAGAVGGYNWNLGIANWRVAYFVGGGLGLLLLVLRIGVFESGMFSQAKAASVQRGNFLALFTKKERFLKYLHSILIGIPIWYIVGLLVFFLPEFVQALDLPARVQENVNVGQAISLCYIGLAIGDISSGLLSQVLKSRKRAVATFMVLTVAFGGYYLLGGMTSLTQVYVTCFLLGFGTGYWAVFVTVASEQFGTNIRATVTTTVPNFVRGSLSLVILLFTFLREENGLGLGMVNSALIVGGIVFAAAFTSLYLMPETYGKDLNYLEE